MTTLRRTLAIASVLISMVLVVLDAAIANVALPSIGLSLHVTPAMSVWIITAYQTALLMALLPCAALGESLGYRRVFTAGVALFIGASALCASAPSLGWLVAARFLQGLGGAGVMALGIALLRSVVPSAKLGAAIGWNAISVALSSAAGPGIGAAILSGAGWPWLFAVNVPLGVLVLVATRALPSASGTARPMDWFSVTLNIGVFTSLIIGSELLPTVPVLGSALFVGSAMMLVTLVRREGPKEAPLIPLDLLRSDSFRNSVIASICCFTGVAAAMVALPFYLQHGLKQSAWMTGLYMTPWPLTAAVAAPLAGRLANRVSTAWLCLAGGVCLSIALVTAALWPLQEQPFPLAVFTILGGFGFGFFQVPNNRNMFLAAPVERSGAAGGMQGTARLAGQTSGAIIMTLLFTMASDDAAPRIGLGIAGVFTLTAGLVSILRSGSIGSYGRMSQSELSCHALGQQGH
jgi:DHA2 family multidrug resistance protein-like MFS transporter